MGVRVVLVLLLLGVAAAGACVQTLPSDWSEPRRDPDPTVDPTRVETGNPWDNEGARSNERVEVPSADPDILVDGGAGTDAS